MGSYSVNCSLDEIVDIIHTFADENRLGDVHTLPDPEGGLRIRTARTWYRMRYAWNSSPDSQGLLVSLRVLPSLHEMAFLCLAYLLIMGGSILAGLPVALYGAQGIEHPLLIPGIAVATLGFLIGPQRRHTAAVRRTLYMEKRFAVKLEFYRGSILNPPQWDPVPLTVQIGVLVLPMVLLAIGAMRVTPIFGIFLLSGVVAALLEIVADRISGGSPPVAWRFMLSGWLRVGTRIRQFTFVGMAACFLVGTFIAVAAKEGASHIEESFLKGMVHPVVYYPAAGTDRSILTADAELLQILAERLGTHSDNTMRMFQLTWFFLACSVSAAMIWEARGYINWVTAWTLTQQRATPTLALPDMHQDINLFARLVFCGSVVAIGIVNLIHLALTIDILSTLLLDRYAFSQIMSHSLGWALLEMKAAAGGRPQRTVLGIVFLLILASPTLLVLLTWALSAVRKALSLRHISRMIVDPKLQRIVGELAFEMGVPMPSIRVVNRGRPYFETIIPWLPARSTLSISRIAIDELNEQELKAAIAHELAHVKHDVRAVTVTRWLSALSLFPCNVFALVLDTKRRELRADQTAVLLAGGPDIVRIAIAKASLGSIFVATRRSTNDAIRKAPPTGHAQGSVFQRVIAFVALVRPLIQPEFQLGYVHPSLSERLAALDVSCPQKPPN